MVPLLVGAAVLGYAVRRVRVDGRGFLAGMGGRVRYWAHRQRHEQLATRTADVLWANIAVGDDHSTWLLYAVEPANYGLLADTDEGLASLGAVERLVLSLGGDRWRLMSTVEALEPASGTPP